MWRFGIDVMVEDGVARVGAAGGVTRQVELRGAGIVGIVEIWD